MGRAIRCATLGMAAAVAALGLLAPPGFASPESDAEDAITAAWKDAGGDSSHLGAKEGDIYPVGDGFAQDFAHGKIFFTPATGAKSMYGAVLDKYESLGGPAGSDLGFPDMNEVPGLASPDSRVCTFAASDKPVIFWTPEHGAFVVRGAINAAWDKLGSSGGPLGVPVGDEAYSGELVTQKFSGGQVSWNRTTKAFSTVPPELAQQLAGLQIPLDPTAAINMAWRAAGGAGGPLGAKHGGQHPIGKDGIVQDFANGKVYFSPATGANAVEGAILAKYESLGGPVGSELGFPVANESDGGVKPESRVSVFSAAGHPVIFWTPQHGAFVVRGIMKAAWDRLGGATGELGAPVGDQAVDGDVVTQAFTGGTVSFDHAKNRFSTNPPKLASALSGLMVAGQNKPSSAAPTTGDEFAWRGGWLLVAIPVLLVVALAALVALVALWRRRRALRRDIATDEADHEAADHAVDHEIGAAAAYQDASGDDGNRSAVERNFGSVRVRVRRGAPSEYPPPEAAGPSQPAPPAGWTGAAGSAAGTVADAPVGQQHPVESDEGHREPAPAGMVGDDPDAVDTAPTPVLAVGNVSSGRGRHAAIETETEAGQDRADAVASPDGLSFSPPGRPAIHLPLHDPNQAPAGYPVKANTSSGLYYTPDSDLYENTLAEIWFVSEEMAAANGFIKAR